MQVSSLFAIAAAEVAATVGYAISGAWRGAVEAALFSVSDGFLAFGLLLAERRAVTVIAIFGVLNLAAHVRASASKD